ncbi:MAG TPA: cysteine hydrolase family protein [Gemmatimonadaceae bacterium]
MTTALLIIDMQRATCSGEWAVTGADTLIDKINLLSARARASGTPVVFVQHEEDEGPFQFDTQGWGIADGLVTAAEDIRVRKKTPNSFHRTDLHQILRERGISRVVVCGVQTECCVDTTVRQALPLGYDVVLASDAHSTLDGALRAEQIIAHHNRTLADMQAFGPRIDVVPAAEVAF